jgi:hypothetical protein
VDGATLAAVDVDGFLALARRHGVLPLVSEQAAGAGDWPPALVRALGEQAREHAVYDLAREGHLRALVARLSTAGLRSLLFKGTQLAYAGYARPDLRPRIDTDLLIATEHREAVGALLVADGYEGTGHVEGTLLMYQACYAKPGHVVDVHWKVANPQVFADLVSYDELSAAAVELPALGPSAFGLSDVHALLVACVHRVAHHRDSDRLIWLYDIHLLAARLSSDSWRAFDALCEARGVTQVCRRSLARAVETLGTRVPSPTTTGRARPSTEAATAAYLNPDRSHARQIVGDLQALPRWRDRARLLGQHVFPSPTYMRGQYAPASVAPLPVLYVRRAVHGAWKWLVRP